MEIRTPSRGRLNGLILRLEPLVLKLLMKSLKLIGRLEMLVYKKRLKTHVRIRH